jgi:transposase
VHAFHFEEFAAHDSTLNATELFLTIIRFPTSTRHCGLMNFPGFSGHLKCLDGDSRQEVVMNKKRGRTAYSDEFRREAVRLVESGKGDVVQVATDLGVHPQSLRSWCRTAARQRAGASTPTRVLLEEENRRLRRENERLKEERDILKKATAFFARDER